LSQLGGSSSGRFRQTGGLRLWDLHLVKGIHQQDGDAGPIINHDMLEFDIVDGGRDDKRKDPCAYHVTRAAKVIEGDRGASLSEGLPWNGDVQKL
jgi:hypothetical protein